MGEEKKNSWDALLEDLGAQPDESAFERRQPPPSELPSTPKVVEPVQPEKSSSDWSSLAESLGIEVEQTPETKQDDTRKVESAKQDEPPKAEIAAPVGEFLAEAVEEAKDAAEERRYDKRTRFDETDETASADEELPPLPSQVDEALIKSDWDDDQEEDEHAAANDTTTEPGEETGGISGEAARSAFDALFADGASGWGSAFLDRPKPVDDQGALTESWGGELKEPAPSSTSDSDDASEDGEEDDQPKRKRSRRRRRGGRGRKPAGEREAADESGAENSDESLGEDQEKRSTEDQSETGESKKPRRRRSRRRGKASEGDAKPARVERGTSDLDDDDDDLDDELARTGGMDDDDLEDEGDETNRGAAARGRSRHRNLPTWSDAIGMIVDGNLEQRAKSPSKSHSQSSRNGGRGRGGRRRGGSGRKPESK